MSHTVIVNRSCFGIAGLSFSYEWTAPDGFTITGIKDYSSFFFLSLTEIPPAALEHYPIGSSDLVHWGCSSGSLAVQALSIK